MEKDNKALGENDFKDFLAATPIPVPARISEEVCARTLSLLHPPPLSVFGKVLLIPFIVGAVSLLFCPHVGLSFVSDHGIMPFLMQFGEVVCMLGCGALFTGGSLLVASAVLKPEEVRALRAHRFLHLASIA